MTPVPEMRTPVKEVEMTEVEERRKEILKHISLGDLTKDDPTQPPDYGEAPKFLHDHRNANCCNRICFFYPRTVMEAHRKSDHKMTSEMLQDLRHDDEETKIMVDALEANIDIRFK